ncbi:MAG TPA: RluA family pseudouridine synthase [Candidatus Saccharimonadales bacterium]|nr:RluA family pseudouridine synthase [Candidatus Saccharimonadales bacterium]
MDIPLIFEDESFVLVDKPAGVTVNRAETTKNETTVQDWAEAYLKIPYKKTTTKFGDKDWKPEDDFYQRGGIVHRLDKETSGILIIAKTPQAFVNLQEQFRERVVKKTYLALAHGIIKPREGDITVPVGRLPWNRNRFGILPGGRESKTLYSVLSYYISTKLKEKFSLVELYPQSGRTHQIRVHLKYINHPIFADFLYAGRKTSRSDRNILNRVFLHAAKITFKHPLTGQEVGYEAPLTQELSSVINSLEKSDI